jgi:hypothetical protein
VSLAVRLRQRLEDGVPRGRHGRVEANAGVQANARSPDDDRDRNRGRQPRALGECDGGPVGTGFTVGN